MVATFSARHRRLLESLPARTLSIGTTQLIRQFKWALALVAFAAGPTFSADVSVCLITPNDTHPFFAWMKGDAFAKAEELGVGLRSLAGRMDGDNEGQVAAMESCVADGVNGILLVPTDTAAIVDSVRNARDNGILVIALDIPLDPIDAADATFATASAALQAVKTYVETGERPTTPEGSPLLNSGTSDSLAGLSDALALAEVFLHRFSLEAGADDFQQSYEQEVGELWKNSIEQNQFEYEMEEARTSLGGLVGPRMLLKAKRFYEMPGSGESGDFVVFTYLAVYTVGPIVEYVVMGIDTSKSAWTVIGSYFLPAGN